MATSNPTPRNVTRLQTGRFRIEIDKRVTDANGAMRRIRIRRVLPPSASERDAHAIAAKLEHDLLIRSAAVAHCDEWADYVRDLTEKPKSWLYVTVQNARHRARERGFECTVTPDQLRMILLRSKGRCEVTGLRFTTEKIDGVRTRPYFHSIDRIDASKGYTVDNLRAVCHAANIAMNVWGEDVFAELARGFVLNRYSAFYSAKVG